MWRRTVPILFCMVVLGLASLPTVAQARTKTHTLLSVSGNGVMRTRTFHAPGKWQLNYSFDCRSSGFPGGVGIVVRRSPDDLIAAFTSPRALSGHATQHMRVGGQVWLDIASRCNWKVTATT